MSIEKFLIDANSFIEPYNRYYPFDLAEKFWEQLKTHIENGSILLLDKVKDELSQGSDSLSGWICNINCIDHRDIAIIRNYGKVLQHIQNNNSYKETALENWSQEQIADPWLIATAITYNYTIITFEQSQNIRPGNLYKNAKIPDIAEDFNVKSENLFYLMRALNIKL